MRKRYARWIFFAAIGGSLALLVTWVSGPSRDTAVTSPSSVRRPSVAGLDSSETPEPPGALARSQADGESREPAPPSVPRDISDQTPSSEVGRFDAAAVDGKLDIVADPVTRVEPVTSADDQSEERPAQDPERPLGWCFRTTLNSDFASDSSTVWNGSRSVLVRKHEGVEPDYRVNFLWQGVDATPYRASRIEVSAHVQSVGGVFLFVQAATRRELLRANNQLRIASSNNRYFVLPTQGWTRLAIVGDIPLDADVMYFGVANNGRASLRVDDVRVTSVGPDSAVTRTPSQNAPVLLPVDPSSISATPINLDFEVTNVTSGSDALPVPSC